MSFGSNHNAAVAPAVTEENLSIKWRVYEDCRLNVAALNRCVCLMEFIRAIIEGVSAPRAAAAEFEPTTVLYPLPTTECINLFTYREYA